jgi:hypothetical protein
MGWNSVRGRLPSSRRVLRWTAGALVLLTVLPLVAAVAFLRGMYSGGIDPQAHTRNRDAVWLGHAWVDGRHDETDLAVLASRIDGSGISDVYVHAGPLDNEGVLSPDSHPRAGWLLEELAEQLPEVRTQAWLGNMLATSEKEGLRLDAATRTAVARSAGQAMDLGFDGVHINIETVPSGDRDYLALLDEVGAVVRGRGGVFSVSAQHIDPLPGLHDVASRVPGAATAKWWAQSYFREVAERADQIAVMSYDAPTPAESLYGGYVAQQTELALQVTPPETDLLMGLPFYHERDLLHRAETVSSAVRGVRLGLSREDRDRERFGVALYVDYGAVPEDWRSYQQDWVATAPSGAAGAAGAAAR